MMVDICNKAANKLDNISDDIEKYLEKIANQDKDALADLYNLVKASVYGFAFSIVKNTEDASDVLQDCFIQIYANAYRYKSEGKPMAWILTITRNLCLMKIKKQSRTSDVSIDDMLNVASNESDISTVDKLVIRQCLQGLKDEERQIVILHAITGLKHKEIAEILGLPLSTVLSKYNRAIKKLAKKLKEDKIYE